MALVHKLYNVGSLLSDDSIIAMIKSSNFKDSDHKTLVVDFKIENGKLNCPATVLRSLSKIYGVSVISMFLIAGYLKRDDLQEYQYVFQGVDKLDDEERKHIQEEIIFLVRKKESAL